MRNIKNAQVWSAVQPNLCYGKSFGGIFVSPGGWGNVSGNASENVKRNVHRKGVGRWVGSESVGEGVKKWGFVQMS